MGYTEYRADRLVRVSLYEVKEIDKLHGRIVLETQSLAPQVVIYMEAFRLTRLEYDLSQSREERRPPPNTPRDVDYPHGWHKDHVWVSESSDGTILVRAS